MKNADFQQFEEPPYNLKRTTLKQFLASCSGFVRTEIHSSSPALEKQEEKEKPPEGGKGTQHNIQNLTATDKALR